MSYPHYEIPAGATLPVLFNTFNSSGASVTLTGLAVTDIEIYKNGSTTQRASDAGYTLLDTDGIDFDSLTGIHGFSIDTSDNTDASFYTVGAIFHVVVSAVTVDSQTVSFIACSFRLRAAENTAGYPTVTVKAGTGTGELSLSSGVIAANVTQFGGSAGTFASGRPETNVSHISGSAVSTTTAQLGVNVVQISTDATAADNLELAFDGTGYAGGTTPQQVVLTTSGLNAVADAVLDEALSGHVAAGSLGARLAIIRSGTAQAGASTTITLDASASAVDDFYNNQMIFIVAGTGTGQGRFISGYVGATKVATVSSWVTNPDNTSVFVIAPFGSIPGATAPTAAEVADAVLDEALSGHVAEGSVGAILGTLHLHAGTAQAATSSSITLDATGSSTTVDFYKYNVIVIRAGTGAGQSRQISAYSAARVATVSPAWTTTPSTDSEYVIIPLGIDASTPASVATAVWAATRAGNATAGTFGEYVNADMVRISGDATAADNLESFTDGTGYAGTNNVIPTVTTVGTVTTLTGHTPQTGDAYARLGAPAGASVSADIAAVKAETASILTDTGTTLDTAITTIDTVVDAIKAKTDSLTFTQAGHVDANVQRINDVAVNGDGSATPWGP